MKRFFKWAILVLFFGVICSCGGGTAGSGGIDISGKVTRSTGAPASNIIITILDSNDTSVSATQTDNKGSFTVPNIRISTGSVTADLDSSEVKVFFDAPEATTAVHVTIAQQKTGPAIGNVTYDQKSSSSSSSNSSSITAKPTPTSKPGSTSSSSSAESSTSSAVSSQSSNSSTSSSIASSSSSVDDHGGQTSSSSKSSDDNSSGSHGGGSSSSSSSSHGGGNNSSSSKSSSSSGRDDHGKDN